MPAMRDASNKVDLELSRGTKIQVQAVRILVPPITNTNPSGITEDYYLIYFEGKPELIRISDPGHLTIEHVNISEGAGAERWERVERCLTSPSGDTARTAS
jgi:hypothetical protein